MKKITLLPKWVLPDTIPSVYDTASGSWIEMASKLYGAMRTLQTEYNSFVDEANKIITEFISGVEADQECFEKRMTKVIHDYLDYLESRVQAQDKVIAEAVSYMKTNLSESITQLIAEMHESGEFDEAVLNAINNIGSRVSELEMFKIEQTEKVSGLETRIISLENKHNSTEYIEEDKKLIIYFDEGSE